MRTVNFTNFRTNLKAYIDSLLMITIQFIIIVVIIQVWSDLLGRIQFYRENRIYMRYHYSKK